MTADPARLLTDRIRRLSAGRAEPFVVALDGRSGAGKTTLATVVANTLDRSDGPSTVTVIEGDLFYAGGSAARWDTRTSVERADQVIDWRRQREVLHSLRTAGSAVWRAFDWHADDWDADTVPLQAEPRRCEATPVVLLEGAYSARPELHDLLDLRVLLDTPVDVRRRQLLEREGEHYRADWEARWSAAEEHYFGVTMTPDRFDLVLRPPADVDRTATVAP